MAEILMAEARVTDLNGKVLYLQAPGTKLVPGHQYYRPQLDHGKTYCACCCAPVVFRGESVSVAGSSFRGRRAHFALAPGKKHDEGCDVITRPRAERHIVPDRTKGYRIHINSRDYSETFNDESGVYVRNAQGRIEIADPDLRDRERRIINTAHDLAQFLATAPYSRINDSKVIFRNKKLDWADFFIYANPKKGHERYKELLDRLEALGKGEETFCAMVVSIGKGTSLTFADRKVRGNRLPIMREGENAYEFITPQIKAADMHNTYIRYGFTEPGDYLVMGVPRLWSHDYPDQTGHYITVSVNRPAAFEKIDLQEILKIRARKGRHPQPAPEPSANSL